LLRNSVNEDFLAERRFAERVVLDITVEVSVAYHA